MFYRRPFTQTYRCHATRGGSPCSDTHALTEEEEERIAATLFVSVCPTAQKGFYLPRKAGAGVLLQVRPLGQHGGNLALGSPCHHVIARLSFIDSEPTRATSMSRRCFFSRLFYRVGPWRLLSCLVPNRSRTIQFLSATIKVGEYCE
jgi:hypothetical protein